MKTLTIKLTAPLQSYGDTATFNYRTSYAYPSKSAVLGMVAAALGYRRDDKRISQLNTLAFAVRIDQPGESLTDFQAVHYKKNTAKVTYRDYLQDAVFIAALGSEDDQRIEDIQTALQHPVFQLFLGRRANAPAGPLEINIFNEEPVEVLKKLPWQAADWYQAKHHQEELFNTVISADANLMPGKATRMSKDLIGSWDQNDRFHKYRAVATENVALKNPEFKDTQIPSSPTAFDVWHGIK